jgi:uncharacterized membrane protein YbhN (UPF0104 family)
MQLKHLTRFGLPLLGVLLFSVSVWAITKQLQQYSYQDIVNSLKMTESDRLVLALIFVALNYLVLTGYEVLACRHIRHPLPYPQVALVAFTSYAVSNSIGFALFTGSAIRYRLYLAWGLSSVEIAQVIAFSNLSFWLGMSAVGGVLFLIEPLAIPKLLHLPFTSVHPLGILLLVATCAYFVASLWSGRSLSIRSHSISLPSAQVASAQIVISAIDWSFAAAVLYFLLPSHTTISYPAFFGIYLLSQIAALVSNVPGGLGVFETIILLLLSPTIPATNIFCALIIYRLIYYLLPLIISLILLGLYELRQQNSLKFKQNNSRRNK